MKQSNSHLLDLKLPLGGLLCFYGLLLFGYGLASDSAMYEKSFGMNLNLAWGILMLAVGLVFVALHFAKKKTDAEISGYAS
jgi:hypothetical protein